MSRDHSTSTRAVPLRMVGYLRKSNEDDGVSIQQQNDWLSAIASRERFSVARVFSDQGKRGWDTKARDAFHALVAFCEEQKRRGTPIDGVATWGQNRLSRADSLETSHYLFRLREAGCRWVFTEVEGWSDLDKMEDRIVYVLRQDASSHHFVKESAKACTRGRIDSVKEGRPVARRPFGYQKEYELDRRGRRRPKRLIPDPIEKPIVQQIFAWYVAGKGSHVIARLLDERGVRTPGGARLWTADTVRGILRNPVYVGTTRFGLKQRGRFCRCEGGELQAVAPSDTRRRTSSAPTVRENTHEAIIDANIWAAAQTRMASGCRKGLGKDGGARPLIGLVRCGDCGAPMVTRLVRGGRQALICGRYARHARRSGCHQNRIDAESLLAVILSKLEQRFCTPRNVARMVAEIRRELGDEMQADKAQAAERRVSGLNDQIERAARRLLTEDDSLLPVLRSQLRRLQEERDQALAQAASLRERQADSQAAEAFVHRTVACIQRLAALGKNAAPDDLAIALAEAVGHVQVFFSHGQHPNGAEASGFTHGVIAVRHGGTIPFNVGEVSVENPCLLNAIPFTAEDIGFAGRFSN